MQLSAANILIAAQQAAKQAPQTQANPKQFSAALGAANQQGSGFAPLEFKQTASPASSPAAPQSVSSRPGATVDIRV